MCHNVEIRSIFSTRCALVCSTISQSRSTESMTSCLLSIRIIKHFINKNLNIQVLLAHPDLRTAVVAEVGVTFFSVYWVNLYVSQYYGVLCKY